MIRVDTLKWFYELAKGLLALSFLSLSSEQSSGADRREEQGPWNSIWVEQEEHHGLEAWVLSRQRKYHSVWLGYRKGM